MQTMREAIKNLEEMSPRIRDYIERVGRVDVNDLVEIFGYDRDWTEGKWREVFRARGLSTRKKKSVQFLERGGDRECN